MRIVALIPARGGSKGIKNKNILRIGGKPLIAHSIEHCKISKYISEVYVSTEDSKIKEISKKYGANIIERPQEIARDSSPVLQVIKHAIHIISPTPDMIVFLQCTSPIRRDDDIDNSIEKMIEGNYDSVFSATKNKDLFWRSTDNTLKPINYDPNDRKRRQDMPLEYIENGSMYVFKTKKFQQENNYICGKIGIYEMPREYSFEIDEYFDFWLCEKILERTKNERD